jgi:hypothetical protein
MLKQERGLWFETQLPQSRDCGIKKDDDVDHEGNNADERR